MTKRIAVLALLALAAGCGPDEREDPVSSTDPPSFGPGSTADLNEVFSSALIGAPGGGTGVTWTLNAGSQAALAMDAGLSLTSAGLLTLPGCSFLGVGGAFPYTITVTATSGATVLLTAPITIDERFVAANVACYILAGESLCRDPNAGGIVVEAGTSAQFYSRVQTSCRSTWSPALPAGACPATDPAYSFCR